MAAVAVLMAVWWIYETIPIAVTGLIPIILFPILGVMPVGEATAAYANPLVFLFFGGFCIAIATERWALHQRAGLMVLKFVGTRQDRIIGGFLLITASISMWVSNTATATMMMPVATTVAAISHKQSENKDFPIALMLAIAFGANIGGMGTLIGTPPNALLAGFLEDSYGIEIGFVQWMAVGVPFAALLLALSWLALTHGVYRLPHARLEGVEETINRQLSDLGAMSRGEKLVALVFCLAALSWVFRPLLSHMIPGGLTDAGIAVCAAVLLFVIPVTPSKGKFLMEWPDMAKLPWGVLVLVGGGLSLGHAVQTSGLSAWLAHTLSMLATTPEAVVIAGVGATVLLISHITSNTAAAATFIPLVASFAPVVHLTPVTLCAPVALAAGCAFMLPVATPPNAIVFASGQLTVMDMVRAGSIITLLALGLLTVFSLTLIPLVL